ncbi:adenine deaminase [Nowakowskiella sp. JEL0078]|nr:adenine deaminase [Nowakowskiella sp. JEL0078]
MSSNLISDGFISFLRELPKCEHHIHIEGSLSPTLLFELAVRNNVTLPDLVAYESPEKLEDRYTQFTSLQDFLDHYYIGMSVLKTISDFESLAWEYFQRAQADGVHHAEVFFDPQAHIERGVDFSTIMTGFTRARQRAEQDYKISSKLIMCFLRHLPPQSALETLDLAHSHIGSGEIHGIGLDSSEQGFPPEMFKEVYDSMRTRRFGTDEKSWEDLNFNFTAHAGEEGPPQYVSNALDHLEVSRIDHGIRSVEDENLLNRLVENSTLLTVCPLSNVRLRCVNSVSELPIKLFVDRKIHFSINSDDPAYFGGYILDNYIAVHEAFEFNVETWIGIAERSVQKSWVSPERREELLSKIQEIHKKYKHLTVD